MFFASPNDERLVSLSLEDTAGSMRSFNRIIEITAVAPEVFNPYRMIILIGLYKAGFQNFQQLKALTQIQSDGNLASHLRALEKEKLIAYDKQFVGRKPLTFYNLTDEGKQVFEKFSDVLETFLAWKKSE